MSLGTGRKMKYNRIRAVGAFWPFLKEGVLTESAFGAYCSTYGMPKGAYKGQLTLVQSTRLSPQR